MAILARAGLAWAGRAWAELTGLAGLGGPGWPGLALGVCQKRIFLVPARSRTRKILFTGRHTWAGLAWAGRAWAELTCLAGLGGPGWPGLAPGVCQKRIFLVPARSGTRKILYGKAYMVILAGAGLAQAGRA